MDMKMKELLEILLEECPSSFLRARKKELFLLISELEECDGFDQHSKWHQYDVLEHIFHVVDGTSTEIEFRVAALFHDIGKPNTFFIGDDGAGHAYGHELESIKILNRYVSLMNLSKEQEDKIVFLIQHHMDQIPQTMKTMKRKVNKYGWENVCDWLALRQADLLGHNPMAIEKHQAEMIRAKEMLEEIRKGWEI